MSNKIIVSLPLERLNEETRRFLMADSLARSRALNDFSAVSLFKLSADVYRIIVVPATIERSTTNFNWMLNEPRKHATAKLLAERVIPTTKTDVLLERLRQQRYKVTHEKDESILVTIPQDYSSNKEQTIFFHFEDICKRL